MDLPNRTNNKCMKYQANGMEGELGEGGDRMGNMKYENMKNYMDLRSNAILLYFIFRNVHSAVLHTRTANSPETDVVFFRLLQL